MGGMQKGAEDWGEMEGVAVKRVACVWSEGTWGRSSYRRETGWPTGEVLLLSESLQSLEPLVKMGALLADRLGANPLGNLSPNCHLCALRNRGTGG